MSRAQLTSTVEQNTGGAVALFVAGKNKIISGDFGIWQRGTSFTPTSGSSAYTAATVTTYQNLSGVDCVQVTNDDGTIWSGLKSAYDAQQAQANPALTAQ